MRLFVATPFLPRSRVPSPGYFNEGLASVEWVRVGSFAAIPVAPRRASSVAIRSRVAGSMPGARTGAGLLGS